MNIDETLSYIHAVCWRGSVPGLERIGALLGSLNIEAMRVLPYHSLARSKYAALGLPDTMPDAPSPDDEQIARAVSILRAHGVNAVSGRE